MKEDKETRDTSKNSLLVTRMTHSHYIKHYLTKGRTQQAYKYTGAASQFTYLYYVLSM